MDVERAAAHRGEERLGDLVAVRGPHEELGTKGEDRGHLLLIEARGLADRQTHGHRRDLHRGLAENSAGCGTIGLCHDPDDLNDAALAKPFECLERANRELRGSQKQSALC